MIQYLRCNARANVIATERIVCKDALEAHYTDMKMNAKNGEEGPDLLLVVETAAENIEVGELDARTVNDRSAHVEVHDSYTRHLDGHPPIEDQDVRPAAEANTVGTAGCDDIPVDEPAVDIRMEVCRVPFRAALALVDEAYNSPIPFA